MRVLLVTPYSPLSEHDHAANDIALPLVEALAESMELHVYAPGQHHRGQPSWTQGNVTYHAGSPVHLRRRDRLDNYPYVARASWWRRSTSEATAIYQRIRPDILHAEYLQTAEPLLRLSEQARTSLTLHDVAGAGARKSRGELSLLRYAAQRLEMLKLERLNKAVLNNIDSLFVRSENDKRAVSAARGLVSVAPVGLNPPEVGWLGDSHHVVAFGGAMWRLENEATAVYLASKVIPLVRQEIPDAELRIFGARPTEEVKALQRAPGVTVVGEVADYDEEFRHAQVVIAPAMVNAGLLMKAVRAMSLGCPIVLNTASAHPMEGLQSGVHALVGDTPEEIAGHIVALMQNGDLRSRLGRMAAQLVRDQFSWERTRDIYVSTFERLIESIPIPRQ